ncbi:beta-galactosidase [Rhodopirellula sallentina SM41]|uniref:Beta-galactosidase n=2 Tax=Rhodopirellula TaxID=265488 RepID=M5TVF0_9BACT|nr:beta-galactosidase [Rhodopirellula sallentina SM41]
MEVRPHEVSFKADPKMKTGIMVRLSAVVMLGIAIQFACATNSAAESKLERDAVSKISQLEALMDEARQRSLDVTREESVVWFSKQFLKFANWDEENKQANEYLFGVYHAPFKTQKSKLAEELPDFERKKVIEMLDRAVATLESVLSGEIKRRPVNKVDWQNIEVGDDVLLSNGKPIFLYDYFSKSVGRSLTDTQVYNDHLGAIYHGGENLYPVDHDRAINSFLLKQDGTFDQELLAEITGIPNSNVGFLLFWNSGIPDWVLRKEPEAQRGRGLFTGYDIDNPLVRDVWGKIARKAGELTKGKKVTQLGYILSNEPHWYAAKEHWTQRYQEMNSVSSYTDAKFKAWLKETYDGNIEKLNENWATTFSDFDSISYPFPISRSHRGSPMWYDWCRFNMKRGTDWFTYLQRELRRGNPDADTSIKLQPNLFSENYRSHGIDVEALTELTSMIGDDAKTQWIRNLNRKQPDPWESHYAYFWEELSMTYDFLESVAPNKIHFNSENHFLSASWVRELNQPAEYVRNVYWLATIQGMDANLAWWWARDPDGSPEDRMEGELNFFDPALAGSYAGSANQQPHIVNAVTQVMYDLNSFSEEVMAIRRQRRPIRLFYSETSAINKHRHMTELFEIYEQLFFEGFPLGFATEKIIQKQDASNWDAIVVYKTEFVTDSEFAALQSYLDNGGTVLMDCHTSLSMNEYGHERDERLADGNGTLVVMDNNLSLEETKAEILKLVAGSLPELRLSEDNGSQSKGCTWRVVRNPKGGFLLNVLNIGKHAAKLNVTWNDGKSANATDMLTEKELGSQFELPSNGVLLLEVSDQALGD